MKWSRSHQLSRRNEREQCELRYLKRPKMLSNGRGDVQSIWCCMCVSSDKRRVSNGVNGCAFIVVVVCAHRKTLSMSIHEIIRCETWSVSLRLPFHSLPFFFCAFHVSYFISYFVIYCRRILFLPFFFSSTSSLSLTPNRHTSLSLVDQQTWYESSGKTCSGHQNISVFLLWVDGLCKINWIGFCHTSLRHNFATPFHLVRCSSAVCVPYVCVCEICVFIIAFHSRMCFRNRVIYVSKSETIKFV